MWRSLWQTPAAFTLTSTCVPVGCGVGWSTSFSGALNSATWKLFIASLPVLLLLSDSGFSGGHWHVPHPASRWDWTTQITLKSLQKIAAREIPLWVPGSGVFFHHTAILWTRLRRVSAAG